MQSDGSYNISLQGMEFHAYHGCYREEQLCGNRIVVDLQLCTQLGEVAAEDNVGKAVNYLTVYEIVRKQMFVTQHTLERVAVNIIEALRQQFPQIESVECRVSKIAPPLGGKVERVSVTLRG